MKLICPSCGAIASGDTWINDEVCRAAMAKVTGLPHPLPKIVLSYCSLFRAGAGRALTWKKVLRLAEEIEAMVGKGYVSVQGKPDKTSTPGMWARGMEQMVEQRAALRLPIANHNYLKKVVWDLADADDRTREYAPPARSARVNSGPQHISAALSPLDQYIQGHREDKPSDDEMDVWKKSRR